MIPPYRVRHTICDYVTLQVSIPGYCGVLGIAQSRRTWHHEHVSRVIIGGHERLTTTPYPRCPDPIQVPNPPLEDGIPLVWTFRVRLVSADTTESAIRLARGPETLPMQVTT